MRVVDLDEVFVFLRQCLVRSYGLHFSDDVSSHDDGFEVDEETKGPMRYVYEFAGDQVFRGAVKLYYDDIPVFHGSFGGGMQIDNEPLQRQTYELLRQILCYQDPGFKSFRGPGSVMTGRYEYRYAQEGDMEDFQGLEEVYYGGDQIYYNYMIGGLIQS